MGEKTLPNVGGKEGTTTTVPLYKKLTKRGGKVCRRN